MYTREDDQTIANKRCHQMTSMGRTFRKGQESECHGKLWKVVQKLSRNSVEGSGRFRNEGRKDPEPREREGKEEASLHYPPLENRDRAIKIRRLGFGLSGYAE